MSQSQGSYHPSQQAGRPNHFRTAVIQGHPNNPHGIGYASQSTTEARPPPYMTPAYDAHAAPGIRHRQPGNSAVHQKRCREKKKHAISSLTEYLQGFTVPDGQLGHHGVADDLQGVRNILEREFVQKMRDALIRHCNMGGNSLQYESAIKSDDPAYISKCFWHLFESLETAASCQQEVPVPAQQYIFHHYADSQYGG